MSNFIQKTTKSDQKIALSSFRILSKSEEQAIKSKSTVVKLRILESDDVVSIPLKALKLLRSITLAEGGGQNRSKI